MKLRRLIKYMLFDLSMSFKILFNNSGSLKSRFELLFIFYKGIIFNLKDTPEK